MNAQYEVGFCYMTGNGTERDVDEGIYWLEHSAEKGCGGTACMLGIAFRKDNEVERNM